MSLFTKRTVLCAFSLALVLLCIENKYSLAIEKKPMALSFEPEPHYEFVPPKPGTYTLPIIKKASDGQVLDIHGRSKSLKKILRGKISIVSFVYLTCSEIQGCPLAISTFFELFHASEKLQDLRRSAQLVTISFDPKLDTVQAINAFSYPIMADDTADRKIKWSVLTTQSQDQLQPILDGYGQVITRKQDSDIINHLLRIFLIDKAGNIRNIYGLGTIDPRLLVTDVETLIIEAGRE